MADAIQIAFEEWFLPKRLVLEFGRSINPPGITFHLKPAGLCVTVLDSAMEDNSPEAILEAFSASFEDRLNEKIKVVIPSNLLCKITDI